MRRVTLAFVSLALAGVLGGLPATAAEETTYEKRTYEEQRNTLEVVPAPAPVVKERTIETVPAAPPVVEKKTEVIKSESDDDDNDNVDKKVEVEVEDD